MWSSSLDNLAAWLEWNASVARLRKSRPPERKQPPTQSAFRIIRPLRMRFSSFWSLHTFIILSYLFPKRTEKDTSKYIQVVSMALFIYPNEWTTKRRNPNIFSYAGINPIDQSASILPVSVSFSFFITQSALDGIQHVLRVPKQPKTCALSI